MPKQGNSDIQIPKKYEEYADVFDKVKASVLPKHRSYDCPIDLQPGQEPPWGLIYNLSPTELEVLRAYIEEKFGKRVHLTFEICSQRTHFLPKKKDN